MELSERLKNLSPENRQLLERMLEGDSLTLSDLDSYAAPQSDTERALAEIFRQVLQCEQVGLHDNFFELGGDSVLSIQILAKARKSGYTLSSQDLFAYPTIAQLAKRVEPAQVVAPVVAATSYRLTPLQEGMLFHTLRAGDTDAYVSRFQCTIHGRLDRSVFTEAWRRAIARHPVLRSVFVTDGEVPQQVVRDKVQFDCGFEDWRGIAAPAREERRAALLTRERARRFDLAQAPLMQLQLVQLEADQHWCLWTHHHLILDGWSQQALLREVFDDYESLAAGREPGPHPTGAPFSAFVDHVRAKEEDAEAAAYWRERLSGLAPSALAPLGRRTNPGSPMEAVEAVLDGALVEDLANLARGWHATPQCLLQGAWALALRQERPLPAVTYGLTSTGRSAPLDGVDHLLGVLINTLPMRVDFPPDLPLAQWIESLQRDQNGLRRFEHSSHRQIRLAAGYPAGTSLFDSIFVYQGLQPGFSLHRPAADLTLDAVVFSMAEDYPLVLVATPGVQVHLELKYQSAQVTRAAAQALLDELAVLLKVFVDMPQATLAHCEATMRGRLRAQAEARHQQRRRNNRERLLARLRTAEAR